MGNFDVIIGKNAMAGQKPARCSLIRRAPKARPSKKASSPFPPCPSPRVPFVLAEERGRGNDALGDVKKLALLVHGGATEECVGLLLPYTALCHQDALGAFDHLSGLERLTG